MAKKKKTQKPKKRNILDIIEGKEAISVLKELAGMDKGIKEQIESIAAKYLEKVDIDEIANSVYNTLSGISIEDVWNRAGHTSEGYVGPEQMAVDMFEEGLENYINEMKRYQHIGLQEKAKKYCMGILKGIYQYDKEEHSEYKDSVDDVVADEFKYVHDEWRERTSKKEDVKEVQEFIKINCKGWNC